VIVKFDTDGKFRGGGTVNAQVVTGRKPNAVVVPEQSVVLRPAGKVVYVLEDGNKVAQRIVQTGYRQGGLIEITAGLAGGETVAVDGAGFLTNNANVAVSKPRGEKSAPAPATVPTAERPGPSKPIAPAAKGGAS
jgi:multidrug efflux pump subunit AcrA (membrane-fusion protein)